ncbi:hypothetical protein IKQ21_02070, partial [bacterium]|nr:hypothetical protein [bacterium]
MEFEIKNIMHDKLRDYANEYDRNDEGKAGVLEKEEFSLFAEDDRVKNLIATEQNAASVFGEIKTAIVGDEITIGQTQNNEVTAQTAAEEETVEEEIAPVQLSDEQRKNVEKTFEAKVKELAKAGKDEEGLVEGLEKAFAVRYTAQEANGKHLIGDIKRDADGNPIIKPQYREYFAKLSDVYQKVQTEGYKAAKKSMDDKFSKKLAESLNRIIEEQKVTDAYNNRKAILDTKINDEKMDFKDAYKAAKKEIKQDENYTKADKKAIKRLKTRAQGMAFDKAQTILTNEETRPEGESYRAFKKEMKSYSDDKFFRKAVKDLKVHEKVLARHNKVDHFVASTIDEEGNSTFTEADMKNGLRKRALFGLVKTGGGQKLTDKLETFRDKNGNYNISALADLVMK